MLNFILIVLALVAAFLVLRHFNCWYWKINEGLATLKEIRDLIKKNENLAQGRDR